MSDQNSLRAKLEAVKSLKGEYYIGSRSAYKYLKAMRWFEELRASVLEEHPNNTALRTITLRELVALCSDVRSWVQFSLMYRSAQISTTQTWSVLSKHYVLFPVAMPDDHLMDSETGSHRWQIDWRRALRSLAVILEIDQGEGEEWKSAQGVSLTGTVIPQLFRFLYDAPMLCYCETGEEVTLSDVGDHPEFFTFNEGSWEDSLCGFGSESTFEEDERQLFAKAERGDADAAHRFLQLYHGRTAVGVLQDIIKPWIDGDDPRIGRDEILEWLYDKTLMQRMAREQVLGRIEVERRIALNVLKEYDSGREGDPEKFIDSHVDKLREMLRELTMKRTKEMSDPVSGAHSILVRYLTGEINSCRYKMLSLRHNRSWLIEFLSH